MIQKKYIVPDSILEVAMNTYRIHAPYPASPEYSKHVKPIVEAVLQDIAENPPMPTEADCEAMQDARALSGDPDCAARWYAVEWMRRAFRALDDAEIGKDGTVEFLTGTTRPIAVWFQGERWPVKTIAKPEEDALRDLRWDRMGIVGKSVESMNMASSILETHNRQIDEAFSRGEKCGYDKGYSERSLETFR